MREAMTMPTQTPRPTRQPTSAERERLARREQAARKVYGPAVVATAAGQTRTDAEDDELAVATRTLGLPPTEFADDARRYKAYFGTKAQAAGRPEMPPAERAKADAELTEAVAALEKQLADKRHQLAALHRSKEAESSMRTLLENARNRIAHLLPMIDG